MLVWCCKVIFVASVCGMVITCRIPSPVQSSAEIKSTEKREIILPMGLPVSFYALQISSDTSFTCFFEKTDWNRTALTVLNDSVKLSNYIFFLDSMQMSDQLLNTSVIPAKATRCGSVSPVATTWRILDSLFLHGQLAIRYSDGTFVKKMECERTRTEISDRTYYRDALRGTTFHSTGHAKQGGF